MVAAWVRQHRRTHQRESAQRSNPLWRRGLLSLLMSAASEEASCEHLRSLCVARAVSTSLWLPLTAKHVNMDLGDVGVVPPSNLAPQRSERWQITPARRPHARPRSL